MESTKGGRANTGARSRTKEPTTSPVEATALRLHRGSPSAAARSASDPASASAPRSSSSVAAIETTRSDTAETITSETNRSRLAGAVKDAEQLARRRSASQRGSAPSAQPTVRPSQKYGTSNERARLMQRRRRRHDPKRQAPTGKRTAACGRDKSLPPQLARAPSRNTELCPSTTSTMPMPFRDIERLDALR